MSKTKTLAAAEKEAIIQACLSYKIAREAADALGISRATLYRRLRKHGIQRGILNA